MWEFEGKSQAVVNDKNGSLLALALASDVRVVLDESSIQPATGSAELTGLPNCNTNVRLAALSRVIYTGAGTVTSARTESAATLVTPCRFLPCMSQQELCPQGTKWCRPGRIATTTAGSGARNAERVPGVRESSVADDTASEL